MAKNKKKTTWDDVQRQCGLNADTIRMARELGMNPRTVIANHASTRQE
jgi:anaerobic selenocysteine-containing dehydrogenase